MSLLDRSVGRPRMQPLVDVLPPRPPIPRDRAASARFADALAGAREGAATMDRSTVPDAPRSAVPAAAARRAVCEEDVGADLAPVPGSPVPAPDASAPDVSEPAEPVAPPRTTTLGVASSPSDEAAGPARPLAATLKAAAQAALAALDDADRADGAARFVVSTADLGRLAFIARRDGPALRVVVELDRTRVAVVETLRAGLAAALGAGHPGVRVSIAIRGVPADALGDPPDAGGTPTGRLRP